MSLRNGFLVSDIETLDWKQNEDIINFLKKVCITVNRTNAREDVCIVYSACRSPFGR